MTKEEIIDNIARLNSQTWKDREEVRTKIGRLLSELKKALEQQPSDDCVSRQAMLDVITEIDDNTNMDIYTNEVREIIRELTPVTPTHGKCKDCTNYVAGALDEEICIRGHELIHKDFYCADYEKRGSKNE